MKITVIINGMEGSVQSIVVEDNNMVDVKEVVAYLQKELKDLD